MVVTNCTCHAMQPSQFASSTMNAVHTLWTTAILLILVVL